MDYVASKKRCDERWWGSQHMNPTIKLFLADDRSRCAWSSLCHRVCGGRHSTQPVMERHCSRTVSINTRTLLTCPNGVSILKLLRMEESMVARRDLDKKRPNYTSSIQTLRKQRQMREITRRTQTKLSLEVQANENDWATNSSKKWHARSTAATWPLHVRRCFDQRS